MFSLEPLNTDTSTMPAETNGFYLDWQTNLSEESE
jgi:peptide/nickel transport system substrate-binding protein